MKRKTITKRRNRIEGQIAREAQAGNMQAAMDLACFGRKLTPLERAVWAYLRARKIAKHPTIDFAKIISDPLFNSLPREKRNGKTLQVMLDACNLCQCFFDAIDQGNTEALKGVVRQVKDFTQNPDYRNPLRVDALAIKAMLNPGGKEFVSVEPDGKMHLQISTRETMTVPEFAASCNPKAPKPKDSQIRFLRGVLKSVAFPMARAGAPKKSSQNKS
jgi:hypothetical protein